ncbi:uncharacterized protein [Apostichopus japonicus]|uniref:uncharacterized protein isoform X3 n=1 Tax=Stichopus japonicus TaxID=307972 RepID=UPI003AB5AF3C
MSRRSPRNVFNTPKTYQPSRSSSRPSPTPSRTEVLLEELGIETDDLGIQQLESSSGSEGEGSEDGDHLQAEGLSSDAKVLHRELSQVKIERDELLLRVKTLREKSDHYQQLANKEKTSKSQQIKILRKTHENQLSAKSQLMQNLHDIIEEQEGKIFELEAQLQGTPIPETRPSTLSERVRSLSDSLDKLQAQMALMKEKQMVEGTSSKQEQNKENTTPGTIKNSQMASYLTEINHLKKKLEDSNKTNQKLQEEQVKLHKIKGLTDNEKEVEYLKEEMEKMRKEKEETEENYQEKLKNITEEGKSKKKQEAESFALKERMKKMKKQLEEASKQHQTELKTLGEEKRELEERLKDEMKTAGEEKQRLEKEFVKEKLKMEERLKEQDSLLTKVESEFEKLKASPKVVEVEVEVEVESEDLKAALTRSTGQCEELKAQILKLKQLCEAGVTDLQAKEEENMELSKQISDQENELESLKAEVEQEINAMKKDKEDALSDLKKDMRRQSDIISHKYEALRTCFTRLRPGLLMIGEEYKQLRALCKQFPAMLNKAIEETKKEIQQALESLEDRNLELEQRYHKELARRKKYHNELVDLKGNIRVFCRVRPIIKEDGSGIMAKNVVNFDLDDDGLISLVNKTRRTTYEMDKVFTAEATQQEVFAEVEPLVVSSVDGYNVCIFAYGQTGSGKTFSMEGPPSNPGINQRALQLLFTEVEQRSSEWEYSIKVGVMEIYNENLRDLLGDNPIAKLDVKLNPEGGLYVPGLTEIEVESANDINEVFQIGRKNRSTASTDMNERSSRSHALLCVTVTGTNLRTRTKTIGRLNLVDLAGSERVGKSGSNTDADRMKEAQNINKSLSALGDVIQALRGKQSHIPYRNSKLTYLLQESLGGDSKTLMLVQVSPVAKNSGESQCTLSFAQRVRSVELGSAKKKVETAEIAALRERLSQYENGAVGQYSSPKPKGTPSSRKGTPKAR